MTAKPRARLGVTVKFEEGLEQDIRRTIEALSEDEDDPDGHWRMKAVGHLQRLLRCPEAIKALEPRMGRPPEATAFRRALAYGARKLQGPKRGDAKRAKEEIARQWGVTEETLEREYTAHRKWVEQRLGEILSAHENECRDCIRQPDGSFAKFYWTRDDLLVAIQSELLEEETTLRKAGGN